MLTLKFSEKKSDSDYRIIILLLVFWDVPDRGGLIMLPVGLVLSLIVCVHRREKHE